MSCTSQYNFCVIRGDTFSLDIGLSAAYAEVIENPTKYEMRLVFKEFQDDDIAPYLSLIALPDVNVDPLIDELPVYFHFLASPEQTETLPDFDIVAYCELRTVTGVTPQDVTRIFNSKVGMDD